MIGGSPVLIGNHVAPPFVVLKIPDDVSITVPAYSVPGAVGSMAMETTIGSVRPVLIWVHEPPPTVLTETPPTPPAYTVEGDEGSTISDVTRMGTSPPVSGDQLSPPSTVLNTPSVPADTNAVPDVEGSVAIAKIWSKLPMNAVGAHVSPASVLRKTLLRAVPA